MGICESAILLIIRNSMLSNYLIIGNYLIKMPNRYGMAQPGRINPNKFLIKIKLFC